MDNRIVSIPARAALENKILKNVYLWMSGGLALTGVIAMGVAGSPQLIRAIFSNPLLFYGLIISELVLVFFFSARVMSLSPMAAVATFTAYSALNGVTLSLIFLVYTGASIAMTFFVASLTFGGMSLFGLTTHKDLSGMGHYLRMALWGIIIASLINFLFRSESLYWLISLAGVGLFTALTAYDTQIIKKWSRELGDSVSEADYLRISLLGALKLYLDFINLFLFLLRFLGRRR